jgi:hypothetical protein
MEMPAAMPVLMLLMAVAAAVAVQRKLVEMEQVAEETVPVVTVERVLPIHFGPVRPSSTALEAVAVETHLVVLGEQMLEMVVELTRVELVAYMV